jgi:hypothetical protein
VKKHIALQHSLSFLCRGCVNAANGAATGLKRVKHSHGYRPAAIVLDIEGTVAPIRFVSEVMFPYARDNVRTFLEANYDSAEARADIEAIRQQVRRVPGPGAFCVWCCNSPGHCMPRALLVGRNSLEDMVLQASSSSH